MVASSWTSPIAGGEQRQVEVEGYASDSVLYGRSLGDQDEIFQATGETGSAAFRCPRDAAG